jgi:hypothetical protein
VSDSSTRLDKAGKFFTAALTAVTGVLTIFGFSAGIPERMLRNQPVAASISFGLIGLAILLAALSTFSFDENHPSYIGLRQNGKLRLLQPGFRTAWRFFLLSFAFLALTTFIVLWLGGLLEEAGFSFIQQLAVALAAGLAALPITFVWIVPAANNPTPPTDNPTPPADDPTPPADSKTVAEMRTRRLLL